MSLPSFHFRVTHVMQPARADIVTGTIKAVMESLKAEYRVPDLRTVMSEEQIAMGLQMAPVWGINAHGTKFVVAHLHINV